MSVPNKHYLGFTLVEMAIVLFIVALLLGGLLPTVSSQIEQQHRNETRKQLDDIQQALIGYAIINGRLPCPASAASNGLEDPVGGGICTHFYDGFVPAATLGVTSGVDNQGNKGFAVDAWGNRIHYAVSNATIGAVTNALTTSNGMKTATISSLTGANLIYVCATSTGITATTCGTAIELAKNVPAFVFSSGKNFDPATAGPDEIANTDGNTVFINHENTSNFDDMATWLSSNILISRMVAAGQLP